MQTQEEKLKTILTEQDFDVPHEQTATLERRKQLAQSYAETENGIAVLSDFREGVSYIFSGGFGKILGLPDAGIKTSSAFEEEIFELIPPDELMERHILELRFFQLQKSLPVRERRYYGMICSLHFRIAGHGDIPVLHRTFYLENLSNGSVWLALCLYTPFAESATGTLREIIDNRNGQLMRAETYAHLDRQLLTPRETDVLKMLAKGMSSKQIAQALCLSVNTVYRHRQNILAALQVSNTVAAVEIGLRLRLIP